MELSNGNLCWTARKRLQRGKLLVRIQPTGGSFLEENDK